MVKLYDASGKLIEKRANSPRDIHSIFSRELGGAGAVRSGFPVAQLPAVYACTLQISEAFAQIPFLLWRQSRGTSRRRRGYIEVDEHPLLELFNHPNERQTGYMFRQAWMVHLLSGGNVWIYADLPNSYGVPRAMFVFGRQNVEPIRHGSQLVGWRLRLGTGRTIEMPPDELLHTPLMVNPYDPIMGLGPVQALQLAIDADYARLVFDRAFYANNATPDAVLTYKPGPLNSEQRSEIREAWYEYHSGPMNAGKMAVIGGDFDFKVWGIPHSQAEFLPNRKMTREEIAAAFGFPVSMLNAQEHAALSQAGIEFERRRLYENGVFPRARLFEEIINLHVVRPHDRRLVAAFDFDVLAVLRDDLAQKATVLDKLVKNGIPVNEAVLMLDINIPPIDGGHVGYLPGNYLPLSSLADSEGAPAGSEQEDDDPSGAENSAASRRYRETVSDLEFVVSRCHGRLRKLLYELRLAHFRAAGAGEEVDREKYMRDWMRVVSPIQVAALQLGYDQIGGRDGCKWMEDLRRLPAAAAENALLNLRRSCENIEFEHADLSAAMEDLLRQSADLFLAVNRGFRDAVRRGGHDPMFGALKQAARDLAMRVGLWAMNAGRHVAIRELGIRYCIIPAPGGCRGTHEGMRYPGDPQAETGRLAGCLCTIAAEGS